jgi:hypothetical protein
MYINNIPYDNVLFVHIPKTGGQSIFSSLNDKKMSDWEYVVHSKHDPLFVLQKNNNISSRIFKFSVVRNPFRRAYSHYKHFNKINDTNYTFFQFLSFIKSGKEFHKTPMILYPQSFYCLDSNGDIGLNKVYKYEFLHDLENDLQITLPHLNRGNYSEEEYFNDYNDSIKLFVIDYFSSDFVNFNYCTDFI